MAKILSLLKERGLLFQMTDSDFPPPPSKVYMGIDPSADGLHLGNLLGLVVLRWFQSFGYTPVVILGGATGQIGDPSGKSKERPMLTLEQLAYNITAIEKEVNRLLPACDGQPAPVFLNNYDWIGSMSAIEYLREVGRYFRMGSMLTKESVQQRLHSEEGMSFTEFSYQTLQGYDFYHLFVHHGVVIQCGGSDQWGNILAGCDLIRRRVPDSVYKPCAFVWPLLVRSDGRKFGKSEEGAIWLNPEKFSPYRLYQYLLQTSDTDVITFMKRLTFMPLAEVDDYERTLATGTAVPHAAQQRLAQELTRLLHGQEGLDRALEITKLTCPGGRATLQDIEQLALELPVKEMEAERVIGAKVIDLFLQVGLVSSRGAGRRLIQNQGAYLNEETLHDVEHQIMDRDLIQGRWLLLRSGKKNHRLIGIKGR